MQSLTGHSHSRALGCSSRHVPRRQHCLPTAAQESPPSEVSLKDEPSPSGQKSKAPRPKQQGSKGGGGGKAAAAAAPVAAQSASSPEEVRAVRLQKVADLRAAGMDAYAYRFDRTHYSAELQQLHRDLPSGTEDGSATVAVVGRG